MKSTLLLMTLTLALAISGCEGRKPVADPVKMPNATIESPEELAAAADIPLYPGATFPEGKSNIKSVGQEIRYEIIMSTPDDPLKVESFYKSKTSAAKIPDTDSLMGLSGQGHFLKFDFHREGDETTIVAVAIKEKKSGS